MQTIHNRARRLFAPARMWSDRGMSKRPHNPRRQPDRQATRRGPVRRRHTEFEDPANSGLIRSIREALRSDAPMDLAAHASMLLSALTMPRPDADGPSPGPGPGPGMPTITLHELVESFIGVPLAETTAVLHVFAAYLTDELLGARIRRELATRRHPLPEHVTRFAEVGVARAMILEDPEGTAAELLLELAGAGVRDSTMAVSISFVLGSIVTDAFVVPESLQTLLQRYAETAPKLPDTLAFRPLALADARAYVEQGIAAYDIDSEGAPESETWPGFRHLLAAVVRGLPEGGLGSPTLGQRWDDDEDWDSDDDLWDALESAAGELAHDFLESRQGAFLDQSLDGYDHALAHLMASAAVEALDPDDLIWPPEHVTGIIEHLLPVTVDPEPERYARAPVVLEAFIRFCHADSDAPASATRAALAALKAATPRYLERRTDPDVVAERELIHRASLREAAHLSPSLYRVVRLTWSVGSQEALEALDVVPLPVEEELDLTDVPADIVDRVCRVAALVDGAWEALFGSPRVLPPERVEAFRELGVQVPDPPDWRELRTAARRLLARVARQDPAIFRRRSRDDTTAAALVWIIGRANGVLSAWVGGVEVASMMAHFGLKGSPSQRAESMLRAIGAPDSQGFMDVFVGTPDLLISFYRAQLIDERDDLTEAPE